MLGLNLLGASLFTAKIGFETTISNLKCNTLSCVLFLNGNLVNLFYLKRKTFKEVFKYMYATVEEFTIKLERTVDMRS